MAFIRHVYSQWFLFTPPQASLGVTHEALTQLSSLYTALQSTHYRFEHTTVNQYAPSIIILYKNHLVPMCTNCSWILLYTIRHYDITRVSGRYI